MDYSKEQHFVQAFIRKDRRERLLYEFTTPKKRYDGVSRFCHQAEELIDPSKIIMEGEDLERRPEFDRFIQRHDEICLVLSPDSSMDDKFLTLRDAVDQAIMCLDAVIIIGSSFAVIFSEPMKSCRGKFLLSEKR